MFAFSLIFFKIRNRTRATNHLMISYLFMGLFFLGYIVGTLVYNQEAIHHRWITASTILVVLTNLILFFIVYPGNSRSKMYNISIFIFYGFSVIVFGIFILSSFGSNAIYHFPGHYWDLDNDSGSAILGMVIGFYIITMLISGIWKFFQEKSSVRWHILIIAIIGFFTFMFPAIANIMSRTRFLERSFYFIVLNFSTTIGFFAFGIYYLQYATAEKTSIITRVLGISFATILLMFHVVCLITIQFNERDFDSKSYSQINSLLQNNQHSPGILYHIDFANSDKSDPLIRALSRSDNVLSQNFNALISERNVSSDVYLKGYVKISLFLIDKNYSFEKKKSLFLNLSHEISIIREKFINSNKESLYTYLKKYQKKSQYFSIHLDAISSDLKKTTDKYEAISFLPVKNYLNKRLYRIDSKGNRYCSYYTKNKDKYFETGFSYMSYRSYEHKRSFSILILLLGITVIIFTAFPITLMKLIMRPLNDMKVGISKANNDLFISEIPIQSQDEIGFLVKSFNDMAKDIFHAKSQLRNNADDLKSEVLKRTAELEETLSRQNGDYFLTSNLIEPLSKNKAHGVNVTIDFIINQKKEFTFRKWKKEIGGDVCMASNLFLKGRLYSVFVNGDAMGKSIQGAGGALVLGAGMQTIIERCRFSSIEQDQYPETWLKKALMELQRMFECFEGAMMMSLVMGLVDDENGMVYYINAEHPWTVLYRNGKSVFIEEELLIRKLGFETAGENPVMVKTFQMQPKDALILGSDGRDDILIGMDENTRIINEDEYLFLKIVERADGNLNSMTKEISKIGELTDDLSLLSVVYNPANELVDDSFSDSKEFFSKIKEMISSNKNEEVKNILLEKYKEHRNSSKILKKLIKVIIDAKDFKGVLPYLDEYTENYPNDTESIFIYSRCLMRSGNVKKAADVAWRTINREPHNTRYKLHLAKLLIHIKDYIAADQILDEVLRIDTENEKAIALKNSL